MRVAYQNCQHSHNYYQSTNFLLGSMDWRWGKKATQGPKFLSTTLLTSSVQPVALNTACASSAALKGGCSP